LQRYGLRANVPMGDKALITLRTEAVKLFNLMTIVKGTMGSLKEPDEIKELTVARLEEAHKTLKSFVEQYEKRRDLNKEES